MFSHIVSETEILQNSIKKSIFYTLSKTKILPHFVKNPNFFYIHLKQKSLKDLYINQK